MADIRQRVEEDRGVLKKIQLIVPGYRGYRIREDLRDSDKMLRMALVKKLKDQRDKVDEARSELISIMPLSKNVEMAGNIDLKIKKLQGQIDHAEGGYSGLVSDIRMDSSQMNRLYEWDLAMLQTLAIIDQCIEGLSSSIVSQDETMIKADLKEIMAKLDELEEKFGKRLSVIQGTEQ
ncbi:MAG: hypothetical protein HPY73_00625 [Methanomassiliicoccales archaeon]|nr:MAG: hypothetical protein HPY73_00625 [Methanomassiliicoccales archaeon]